MGEFARPGQHLVTGHAGHALVGQDHRDVRFALQQPQRIGGRGGGEDVVLVLEQVLQRGDDLRLVIHQQDRAPVGARPCRGAGAMRQVAAHGVARSGTLMVKRAPPSGEVPTAMCPS